jgi:uncharacterized membrane protein YfcA
MTASIMEALIAMLLTTVIMIRKREYIDWKLVLPCAAAAMLASFPGVSTLTNLDEKTLQCILGSVLIGLGVYFLVFSKGIRLKPTVTSGIIAGTVSGFAAGLFNIGGPPMVAYFLSVSDDKEKYHATLQTYFTLLGIAVIGNHLLQGHITTTIMGYSGVGMIGALCGGWFGLKLFARLSFRRIKIFMYVFMIVSGIYTIIAANL